MPTIPERLFVGGGVVLFAAAICLRMPEILIKGRFWCEEGNIFFHNAWVMPPMAALFNSFGGYLNLAANGATLAARWLLPLRLAPYLTITVGLLAQICPAVLLLSARDGWLRPHYVRVLACLMVLFVPAVDEIWLQTLHCQFQLSLCCGIILALQPGSRRAEALRYGLLFLAPLCGPGAIAILPLMAGRAALERSMPRALQAAALGLGSFLQLALFFHNEHNRAFSLNPVLLLDIFAVRHLMLPFIGIDRTSMLAPAIKARYLAGYIPRTATLLPLLVFVPYLVLTLWRRATRPAFWLLLAGGVLGCTSYFGVLGGASNLLDARAGGRYIFATQAMLALSVLAVAATTPRWTSRAAWAAVGWMLLVGGRAYIEPWAFISDGPPWRAEVARWEADPGYKLHVWYAQWHPVVLPVVGRGGWP